MSRFAIYQVKDGCPGMFIGTMIGDKDCQLKDGKVKRSNYRLVYMRVREGYIDLDDLFYEFNEKIPGDFTGHSLSTSDIIEIDGKLYFCDSIGWQECKWI